ncbi:phosphate ABC transporter substrate-binding protein PstS, partial [Streptomyces althioticus]
MKLQRNGRSKALAIGAMALVSSLSLAACGSDNNTNTASGGSNGSSAAAAAINCGKAGTLLGAGSTAQAPAIDVWKTNFG